MDFENGADTDELVKVKKSDTCMKFICRSPFFKYILPSFLLALAVFFGAYHGVLAWLPKADSESTCHLQESYYVPCLPGRELTVDNCTELGCCWRDDLQICYHAFPSRYGYRIESFGEESGRDGIITPIRKNSPAGKPMLERLAFSVREINNNYTRITLKRANFNSPYDNPPNNQTFVRGNMISRKLTDFGTLFDFLPFNNQARITKLSSEVTSSMDVLVHDPNFSVTVARSGKENSLILSTARGPLIVTENYWEWSLYLTNGTLYGLDNLELNGTSNWIYNNENETMRPAFLAIDPFGSAMSCFIKYDGPLEVQVLNVSNLVILRGYSLPAELSIDVLSGPTGLQAARQLSGAAGRPSGQLLYPESLLGLHLCPELKEPTDVEVLDQLKASIASMAKVGAPWASHCLFRGLSLALESPGNSTLVAEALKLLREHGKSLAAHLTPMLFNKVDGELQGTLGQESCLLRNGSFAYLGTYEGQDVVYPNWAKSETRRLARNSLDKYNLALNPDFLVLRDAWPKDEKPSEIPSQAFEYLPEGLRRLMSRTVPFDLDKQHYAIHNSYASSFLEFVADAAPIVELRGQRCNSPDVEASWQSFRSTVEAGLVSAMTGQVPSAMYVCGADKARVDEELCIRWYGAAVAWPRILVLPEKSPGGTQLSQTGALQAAKLLTLRASLASYQRTVLALFVHEGLPIFSTPALHYPDERQPRNTTYSEFFWGDSILVGLVTYSRRNQVTMWLPGIFSWRHLEGGSPLNPTGNGTKQITAPYNQIVTLVRPGRIVPLHKEESGSPSGGLRLVAHEAAGSAEGSVYYGGPELRGAFLRIRVLNASLLTLENARQAREAAGCGAPTRLSGQPTLLHSLELLGDQPQDPFPVNLDICSGQFDFCSLLLARPTRAAACV